MEQELQQVEKVYTLITEFFVNYSFQIIGALIIFVIGVLVARKVGSLVQGLCEKKNLDITLSRFAGSTTKLIIIVMVAIIALGKMGISVTPFVAAIGALSLGAGLAVQGLLSNYGAGLNIIITRPYVVGDTIRVKDVVGQVKEVHLGFTILVDEDDVEINIPNKHIVGEIIHNSQEYLIVEASVGIAYDSDTDKAIQVITDALAQTDKVTQERKPLVGIEEFADSSINIGMRFWVPTVNYFETKYRANAAVLAALKSAEIEIPFPQREVRMLNEV